ncbi:retrovirus-related Pol polyprotein from transposon opus [Trichonephila inaurata madagascariensis]|uniref:Retrovirus-related Pol polyprotein from transposon opus n=1 Tax=Trichonephila inaurata madagascariensis TaxID=2747483 RepID=A0A8X7C9T3_9ARAC|nr:retrovirus-related Pol polyprotein from transposon opus [Trichonephila inaurata madagascariensis]
MRTFDPNEGDICFYLILFKIQAPRVHIKEEDWVTNLVGLLPLEMENWIVREPEEKILQGYERRERKDRAFKVAEVKISEVQVAEVKVAEDEGKVVTERSNGEVVMENKK